MVDLVNISNAVFERTVRDYHQWDDVDKEMSCPYEKDSLEYTLYCKCWIDVVQWHLEDIIRDPEINAEDALMLKRRIDKSNQDRTDIVERLDDYFLHLFNTIPPIQGASINTESPAWAVDRLSILHIKIWHMREQVARTEVPPQQHEACVKKLQVLEEQLTDLSSALHDLFSDYANGKKIIKTYRQMKMYNDPNLNPVLYKDK